MCENVKYQPSSKHREVAVHWKPQHLHNSQKAKKATTKNTQSFKRVHLFVWLKICLVGSNRQCTNFLTDGVVLFIPIGL